MTPKDKERKAETGLPPHNDVESRGSARPASPDCRDERCAGNQSDCRARPLAFGTHTPLPGWVEYVEPEEAEENDPDCLPTGSGA